MSIVFYQKDDLTRYVEDVFGIKRVADTWDARSLVRYQGRIMETCQAVRQFCTENHDSGDEHRGPVGFTPMKWWE